MRTWLQNVLEDQARRFDIDAKLVSALITVESGGDEWAYRYEPGYIYLFKAKEFAEALGVSQASEATFQKTSFGLMQLMGGRARELGHKDQLSKLFLPDVNIEMGIRHLLTLRARYAKLEDQISAYNQGSAKKDGLTGQYLNQRYVDKVLSAFNG